MGGIADVDGGMPGEGRGRLASYAPATGEKLGDVPNLGAAEVRAAVERAREAQPAWASLALEERCERVLGFRDALVDRAEELATLLSRECGKPRTEALTHELMVLAGLAGFYAKKAPRILAPHEIELQILRHRRSYVHYAPRGVVGVLGPWNLPLVVPFGEALAALVAGNAAVVKPSELTPLVALLTKEIFDEAGMPSELLQVVTGDAETGAALIEARPDLVVFTGTVANGRKVAAACGERLIPCTLELAGKAAAIVCADADLERTSRALVFGAFANSGQSCVSVERVFAHEEIHDALVARMAELTSALRQGDPERGDTDVGAMTQPRQVEVAVRQLEDALGRGAELRAGGAPRLAAGPFFPPTLLAGCTAEMPVMRDETLGPILPVMRVDGDDLAVELTNDSPFGLMAYVFTKDRDRGRRLAERLRVGTVMVNGVLSAFGAAETPFGGVKNSGIGRIHGEEGLRAMCEIRHVNYDRVAIGREPVWFPYSERGYAAAKKALRLVFRSGSPMKKLLDLF